MLVVESKKGFAMKVAWAGIFIAVSAATAPVWAADDVSLWRLAICRDSWLNWRANDSVQLKTFGDDFQANFSRSESGGYFVPKTSKSIEGLPVVQVFPESVGMGVGFSVVVGATFAKTQQTLERALGKALKKCDVSDNMRTCELEIGEKRTLMLMAEDNAKSTKTLLGCYYYYEK